MHSKEERDTFYADAKRELTEFAEGLTTPEERQEIKQAVSKTAWKALKWYAIAALIILIIAAAFICGIGAFFIWMAG